MTRTVTRIVTALSASLFAVLGGCNMNDGAEESNYRVTLANGKIGILWVAENEGGASAELGGAKGYQCWFMSELPPEKVGDTNLTTKEVVKLLTGQAPNSAAKALTTYWVHKSIIANDPTIKSIDASVGQATTKKPAALSLNEGGLEGGVDGLSPVTQDTTTTDAGADPWSGTISALVQTVTTSITETEKTNRVKIGADRDIKIEQMRQDTARQKLNNQMTAYNTAMSFIGPSFKSIAAKYGSPQTALHGEEFSLAGTNDNEVVDLGNSAEGRLKFSKIADRIKVLAKDPGKKAGKGYATLGKAKGRCPSPKELPVD